MLRRILILRDAAKVENNRTSIANQSREVGNLLAFSLRSRMAEQDLFSCA